MLLRAFFAWETLLVMDAEKLITSISESRLHFYTEFLNCNSNEEKIGAYLAYQDLSGEFFQLIQMIEVALRNAINNSLIETHGDAWFDSILSSDISKALVTKAKKDCLTVSNDNVICRLTLGFWVYMLDVPYRDTANKISYIWSPERRDKCFSDAKNPWGANLGVKALFDEFHKVLLFRNRLFHHEPIWKKHNCNNHNKAVDNIRRDFTFLMKTLSYVSPEKASLLNVMEYPQRFEQLCVVEHVTRSIERVADSIKAA